MEHSIFIATNNLLTKMVNNKEYYLATGKHAAIVRKSTNGFEYLELQTKKENGFKKLTKDVLKNRFSCKKSHSTHGIKITASSILIETETLTKNKEFKAILEYINTDTSKQQKGVNGFAK